MSWTELASPVIESVTHNHWRTIVPRKNQQRIAPILLNVLYTLALATLTNLHPASATEHEAGRSADAPGAEHAGHAHHHHMQMSPGYQRSQATYSVPDVTLIDQHGQRVSLPELLDSGNKPVMLNFIFTSCTAICPMMTAIFAKVQSQLGDDVARVQMVSVSIDPEHDTPAELATYAERFGAGPQWEFLTGSLSDSITVQQAFDAYRGDKMNHAALTLFRAAPGSPWVRYDGFADATDLTKEYRSMLVD
jgi:protein SCO1/2